MKYSYRISSIFLSIVFSIILIFVIILKIKTNLQDSQNPIRLNLQKLTLLEKEYLTNFFKMTFFVSSFGYTIFGDKPMSIETVDMVDTKKSVEGFDYMDLEHIFDRYCLKEGWEVWQKYLTFFPLNGYSTISYPIPHAPSNQIEIAIINNHNFIRIVEENLFDFQMVIGNALTSEEVFHGYINITNNVFQPIRNHEGLFGILLGYGRENSMEYMKLSGGQTLEAYSDIEPIDTQHILPPLFKVIPNSKETYNLRKKYEDQRIKIDEIYQNKNFLEKVLIKLNG